MNDTELFLTGLDTLRKQLLATAGTIEVFLELASRPGADAATAAGQNASCRHPAVARVPTPAMGHANRFICRICEQEVEE